MHATKLVESPPRLQKSGTGIGAHNAIRNNDNRGQCNSNRYNENFNAGNRNHHISDSGLNQQISKHGVRNMSQELVRKDNSTDFSVIEQVVLKGDLSKLNEEQRVHYYHRVCESAGLNPVTRPFEYITLNGKLTLYARKDCTEQLRKINGISIEELNDKIVDDLYIVKAKAKDRHGRTDESTGAVVIGNLKGEARANAIMKAETKAKRRVTLSICGMGWVDESEVDSIPDAKIIRVNHETGEIEGQTQNIRQKISQQQAYELKMVLDECDKKYQIWFYDRLKQTCGSENIADFPIESYEKMKSAAVKNMEQNHAKQMVEFAETQTEELVEVAQ